MNKLSTYDVHRLAIISDIEQSPVIETSSYQASFLEENEGQGFIDIANFQRLQIVRSRFILKQAKSIQRDIPLHFLGVNLFLEGNHQIYFPQLEQSIEINAPCLLLRKGYLGEVIIDLPKKQPIAILSLDLNNELLQQLDPHAFQSHLLQFNNGNEQLKLINHISSETLIQLQKLLSHSECRNELELIQLESYSLTLLSLLLQENHQVPQFSQNVQNTMQILQNNFSQKITIPQLARIIGSNECDLKRTFKAETGSTIHEYRTTKKMEAALQFLNNHYPLIQIADLLGYSNVYYFIRVFTKYFGYPPIESPKKFKNSSYNQ